jgi:hypothetical protein
MHSRLLAGVLALAGLQAQPGDIPITGVELRSEQRTIPVDVIVIRNRHHAALLRWTVKATGDRISYNTGSDHSMNFGPMIPGRSAILPNEVRRMPHPKQPEGSAGTVAIELAVFANGDVQGTRAAVANLERESAGVVEELVFWQTALDTLPRSPQSDAYAYVRNKLNERRQAAEEDHTGIRARIESFFTAGVPRPIWWTFSAVDGLKKDLAEQLSRAGSIHAGARTPTFTVTAVEASVETGTANAQVIVLKNLRSLPLEAWGYQQFAPGSLRPTGGLSSDTLGRPSGPGVGPIAPGEAREVRTLLPAEQDQPAASFAPWFAVWEDLIWQGSVSEHASLMERRRQQAEIHAFWIAQLKSVSTMAPQAAITSLRAARDERRRSEAGDRGRLMDGNLETFARTADRTPDQLRAQLELFLRTLERQYARLTRTR